MLYPPSHEGTVDDAAEYAAYVRDAIRRGLWSLENEPTFTQEEVERAVAEWLSD